MFRSLFQKYYSLIFVTLLTFCLVGSFFLGVKEGERNHSSSGNDRVVFACTTPPVTSVTSLVATASESFSSSQGEETPSIPSQQKGMFVGSKNGTKYYTPGCPGTTRIKPENYIWFQNAEDATLQGYSKGSC